MLAATSLVLVLPALPVCGQATGGNASGRPVEPVGAAVAAPAAAADTAGGKAEIVPTPTPQDTLGRPKSRADTVLVVQHSFNHRQQIITGSVVMSCLALMMVIMNNYNPR